MARILVIDDDEVVLKFIRSVLETLGQEVEVAMSGQEGIDVYIKTPFDLVITDLKMQGKSGFDVICELKQVFPRINIIAMSGYGTAQLNKAMELGACATLSKPFEINKLFGLVQKITIQ